MHKCCGVLVLSHTGQDDEAECDIVVCNVRLCVLHGDAYVLKEGHEKVDRAEVVLRLRGGALVILNLLSFFSRCWHLRNLLLGLVVGQGGDEDPVEVDDLVEGEQGGVVRPHLLISDLTVLRYKHVADHICNCSKPTTAAPIRKAGLISSSVLCKAPGHHLAVAVQGELLVEDGKTKNVRV